VPRVIVTAAIVAAFALAAILLGLPFAVLVRGPLESLASLVADALVLGLVVLGLGASSFAWLGPFGLAVVVAGWIGAVITAVIAAVTARSWPKVHGREKPSRHRHLRWAAWVFVIALALVLRLHEVNFLPWIGDMGAYVNWANQFARTGEFSSTWPPLFPSFLAISSAVFGSAHTTAPLALTGIAALVAIVRLLERVGVSPVIRLIAALAVALHPEFVWFSTFPGSESLAAPLTVVFFSLVLVVLRARGSQLIAAAGILAMTVAALSLLRGSGPLLAIPLVVVLVLAIAVRPWRRQVGPLLVVLGATSLGAAVGYWYGITEIRSYFIANQLSDLLPTRIFDAAKSIGVFEASPVTAFALAGTVVALVGVGAVLIRRNTQRDAAHGLPDTAVPTAGAATTADSGCTNRSSTVVGVLLGSALLGGSALTIAAGTLTGHILVRLGAWYVVAAAIAIVVVLRSRSDRATQLVLASTIITAIMFIALHTARLGFNRGHTFYLYWDRYLFSEVLPCLLVLSFIALDRALPLLRQSWRTVTALVGVVALIVVPAVPSLALQSQDTFLRGAYPLTVELESLASREPTPVVWGADSPQLVADWPFPNTWMGFALPLRRTFGVDVVNANMGRDNLGTDDVLDADLLRAYFACRPDDSVITVFEAETGGAPLDKRVTDPGLAIESLGGVSGAISTMQQPSDSGWLHPELRVTAWRVTLLSARATEPAAYCSPDNSR
jgi:hypothetical protein